MARHGGSDNRAADETIELLVDLQQIKDAISRYCRGVDRKDRALVRSAYWRDAWDDHGVFAGKRDAFIAWLFPYLTKNFGSITHLIANQLIEVRGDRAFSESYFHSIATFDEDASQVRLSYGRYLDGFERRRGEWRIAHRMVAYDVVRMAAGCEVVAATRRSRSGLFDLGRLQDDWLGLKISGLSETNLCNQR